MSNKKKKRRKKAKKKRASTGSVRNNLASPVLTKADFVRRYEAGEFGNRAPTWDTLDAFLASGYRGLVHLRNRQAGGQTWYNVPSCEVAKCTRLVLAKHPGLKLYYSAMAPTELTTLQGEVCRSHYYLSLTYSTVIAPMRSALTKQSLFAVGLTAVGLLKQRMNAVSYDWLQYLLEAYEDHVIEFSCYSTEWGSLPGYNTVFWEVRRY